MGVVASPLAEHAREKTAAKTHWRNHEGRGQRLGRPPILDGDLRKAFEKLLGP